MDKIREIILEMPFEMVDGCSGLSIDFGGSVCKIIYVHKEDWKAVSKEKQKSTICLRLATISRTEFQEGFNYLKSHIWIRPSTEGNEKPLIYTTGIGSAQFSQVIQDSFDIRTCNLVETECATSAFYYILMNMKGQDMLHKLDQNNVEKALTKANALSIERKKNKRLNSNDSLANTDCTLVERDITFPQQIPIKSDLKLADFQYLFPCMLVMIGSNGGIFIMNKDGTYGVANNFKICGRVLLGLGSLLTNCKSFSELMSKAERGNLQNITEYTNDVTHQGDNSQSCYAGDSTKNDDTTKFLFGKCAFKEIEEFRSEDLALGVADMLISELVESTHQPLQIHPKKEFTATHFLKYGSFLGALGALLHKKLNVSVEPSE